MPLNFASFLLVVALVATILPPGYPAYIGAYVAMVAALLAIAVYGWRDLTAWLHPVSLAILASLLLLATTVPFTYQSGQDSLAPVLLMPMLVTIGLGLLAKRVRYVPTPATFAALCLLAAAIALAGGAYETLVLGVRRPGIGNNPIHFGSLAVMSGCLAMIGVTASKSRWRYLFLLGPVFGLGAAAVSGSRGPTAGALVMIALGIVMLLVWYWRDRMFRLVVLAGGAVGAVSFIYLASTGDARIVRLGESALDIFRFTGGRDDIRAALYAAALHILQISPWVGVGLGQMMGVAEALFPDIVPRYHLENLHADWANFAGMAGGLGLAALLLLLVAPLLLLLEPVVRRDRPIVLGVALLVTGQFTLGVSNALFGILPQTMVFAVTLGYLVLRARRLVLGTDMLEHRN